MVGTSSDRVGAFRRRERDTRADSSHPPLRRGHREKAAICKPGESSPQKPVPARPSSGTSRTWINPVVEDALCMALGYVLRQAPTQGSPSLSYVIIVVSIIPS